MNDRTSRPAAIRVLAVVEASSVTGPAKNLIAVATELARSEHPGASIRVVTFIRGAASNAFVAACQSAGIEVDVIGERYSFDLGVIPQLRRVILGHRPDIIQTHSIKSHFLIRLSGAQKRIPWIAFHHGYTAENLKMRLYNQLDRWSLRGADRVVTVCGAFAAALQHLGVRQERLTVLHNAVSPILRAPAEEVIDLRRRLGIPFDALVLLSVGRLSAEKAHCDLVRAVAALKQGGTAREFRLVLVGSGPELSRIQELRRALGVEDLVVLAGTTTNMAQYYSLADVFVLPSHSEGSPNALLEAMMAGLPVVAAAVGGVPEIVESGTNGLLVPARDIQAMSSRIAELLGNEALRRRLGEHARTWVEVHHSRESYVSSVRELYRQVAPKLNILLVIESLVHRGGTELQLLELVSRVDRIRFRMHVCCFEKNVPPLQLPGPHRIMALPLTKVNSLAAIGAVLRLRAYIQRNKIDIVQTFMFKGSVIGVLAALDTRCRAIITSRRSLDFPQGHPRLVRFLNRRTTRILANAEAVKSKVAEMEQVSPDKIDVLYNGVDLDRFSPRGSSEFDTLGRLGIPEDAVVVGIVANLRPVKDIPLFLRAAQIVAARVPRAVFLVVGQGPMKEELEALASELGIREKVFFAGGAADVAEYLPCIRVGCLSSEMEGFSNAILEYMAAGIPVVATAVGGSVEAILHGVTGYLVEKRCPAEFAGYVTQLLQNEEDRVAMGRRGNARCREIFDIQGVVRRHEEYWTRLFVSNDPPPE